MDDYMNLAFHAVGQQILATLVLTGVVTEEEMPDFLEYLKHQDTPHKAEWDVYVRQVKEWRHKRNQDSTKTRGKLI